MPGPGNGPVHIQTFDGLVKTAHEAATSKFTVGINLESEVLLAGENPKDVLICEFGALFRRQIRILVRVLQFFRPQEAPDVICSILNNHSQSIGKSEKHILRLHAERGTIYLFFYDSEAVQLLPWQRLFSTGEPDR